MVTDFEKLTAQQQKCWDQECKIFYGANFMNGNQSGMTKTASLEKADTPVTPIIDMTNRIDNVINRIRDVGAFTSQTVDRLTGSLPQEAAAASEVDLPAGEYFTLADSINRLEIVTTYLEAESDRLHTL